MGLERGIDYWVGVNSRVYGYRVRLNRNGVRYKIGVFPTYDEAVKAKYDFLEEYSMREDIPEAVPQYSKEWFNREHKKQVEKFRAQYSTPHKDRPIFIIVEDNATPHYIFATSSMKRKQESSNDGDGNYSM